LSDPTSKEERLSNELKKAAYATRLGHLRRGQEHAAKNEISKAVENYLTYLKALETYFSVKEENLSPKLFDKKKDLTELLLISHVYWDLAKAYDKNPKTVKESNRCLNQFVKFSIGFKYQRLNSDILRKYIKKKIPRNDNIFKDAYDKIRVSSKGCYIATHCYHEDHYIVEQLRNIRANLIHSKVFRTFCKVYYYTSPLLIRFGQKNKTLNTFFKRFIFLPLIHIFLKIFKSKRTY
jgi:hypothetical protein